MKNVKNNLLHLHFDFMFKFLQKPRYYAALHSYQQHYLLAAIKKTGRNVSFIGFDEGPLQTLAKRYSNYSFAIAIPDEKVVHQTWFFPRSFSEHDIYQQIKLQQKPHTYFDIELLNEENHLDEYLVLGNFIDAQEMQKIKTFYDSYGFKLSAIETLAHLEKRGLYHEWQMQALDSVDTEKQLSAQIILKLLDRENFYVDEFAPLA